MSPYGQERRSSGVLWPLPSGRQLLAYPAPLHKDRVMTCHRAGRLEQGLGKEAETLPSHAMEGWSLACSIEEGRLGWARPGGGIGG